MTTPTTVGVKQSTSPDRQIDSIVVINEDGASVVRQRIAVGDIAAASTVVTGVAATTTPFTVGANTGIRVAITVYNDTTAANLYLKFGGGVTVDSFSNVLGPGDYWESAPPRYTGPTTAVWDTAEANGRAMITEFLPA